MSSAVAGSAGRDSALGQAPATGPPRGRTDLVRAALVFVGLFALFVAVERAQLAAIDAKVMLAVARSIAHGRLSLTRAEGAFRNYPYANYGIGQSLFLLPFYLLQTAVATKGSALTSLTNPFELALTGLVLFRAGRELGWTSRASLIAPFCFGWLTMALPYSTEQFSEPGVSLGIALLVLGYLRWRRGIAGLTGPGVAGAGIGLAILFRSDSVITVGVPGVVLLAGLVRRPGALRPVPVAWFATPILLAIGWTMYYSELRSGTLVPRTYGGSFSYPLAAGLHGLLASPAKGFFYYNPLLLLAIPGVTALYLHRERALAAFLVVVSVVRLVFFARWNEWFGGVAWGPRFLMPLAAPVILAVAAFVLWLRMLAAPWRVAGYLVVAASAATAGLVNLAAVWVPYEAAWAATHNPPAALHGAARAAWLHVHENAYLWSWPSSSLGYNLHRMLTAEPTALHWFRQGADPSPVGLFALFVAVLAPITAVLLAQ